MSIEAGEQVLPSGGFEGFSDEDEGTEALSDLKSYDEESDDSGDAVVSDDATVSTNDASADTAEDEDDFLPDVSDDLDPLEDIELLDASNANADDEANSVESGDANSEPEKKISKKEKFERYSKSVQKRINKEVRQREELKAQNAELHARIANIENTMVASQENNEDAILQNRLRNATTIKQRLLEEGEYAKAAEVDNDIIEMRIRKNQVDSYRMQQQEQQQYQQQQYQQQQYQQQQYQPQPAPVDVPNVQTGWIKNNQRYGRENGYTTYVNETYDRMIEEGYNPEDKRMYAELDKRIGRSNASNNANNANQSNNNRRNPSAPPPNSGYQAQSSGTGKGITEADKANMKAWGLDPANVNQRKEWLNNKKKR